MGKTLAATLAEFVATKQRAGFARQRGNRLAWNLDPSPFLAVKFLVGEGRLDGIDPPDRTLFWNPTPIGFTSATGFGFLLRRLVDYETGRPSLRAVVDHGRFCAVSTFETSGTEDEPVPAVYALLDLYPHPRVAVVPGLFGPDCDWTGCPSVTLLEAAERPSDLLRSADVSGL